MLDIQARFDIAWRNRIDTYTAGRILQRQRPSQANHAVLGHRVRKTSRNDGKGMRRGHIDNAATAAIEHGRQRSLTTMPHAVQIDRHAQFPVIHRRFQRFPKNVDTRVVDQHIDASEPCQCCSHHGLNRFYLRHIGMDEQCGCTLRYEFTRFGGTHCFIQFGNHQAGAFPGEAVCHCSTDALASTSHDANFSLKPMSHVFSISDGWLKLSRRDF